MVSIDLVQMRILTAVQHLRCQQHSAALGTQHRAAKRRAEQEALLVKLSCQAQMGSCHWADSSVHRMALFFLGVVQGADPEVACVITVPTISNPQVIQEPVALAVLASEAKIVRLAIEVDPAVACINAASAA